METETLSKFVPLAEAKKIAREVADYLRRKFNVSKVVLFGSVVEGFYVPGHSDIDVYYEGNSGEEEFDILSHMLGQFTDYAIDYRPSRYCREEFRAAVLNEGLVI